MDVTGDTIANEVVMTRQSYADTIFIVEGDNDEKLFRRFMRDPDAAIISAWGKQNALDAADILDRENKRGYIAIVDADFWHLDGISPSSPNVLCTDDHDIEMMMVRSNSFISVMRELGSKSKIAKLTGNNSTTRLRDVLLGKALCVGILRRYSVLSNLGLSFEGLNFENFVDRSSLDVNIDKLVLNTLALTSNKKLKYSHIISDVRKMIASNEDDPYQVCCGHDFFEILAIGLRKVLGSKSSKITALDNLESVFRISYDTSYLIATQLYKSAKLWEKSNKNFSTFINK